ncbi:hypothetical protein CPB84DRAFT_1758622 [Gymnopilus junonius]|uniref:Uncharacterized protein n=1 Tax=Gymnopilus junonius TaxID=109634 RepID=A0A9P5TV96_GYMJU|nr:hypothetical protein CPB84DRAFT_1758622 [Gymnopilus junonius]
MSMPSRTSLAELLLGRIYGPYPDHIILRHDFPRKGSKLRMKAFQMHFSGDKQVTGFDETEYITNPPVGSRLEKNPEVVFFGMVEVENLDWLSEKGLEYLEADFKEHEENACLDYCRSGLTLKTAYELRKLDSPFLRVKVCCRKSLLAHFLTSKNDPEKLLVYSQSERVKRIYWIQSLHPVTYAASRNFFDRYRLRALIEELVLTDPNHTPLEDRNINWLIKRYFETIRPRDKEKRYIMKTSIEDEIAGEPRHLRHISHAEIRSYFAAHAEWLLAQQIASKQGSNKLVNPREWITFCKEVRKDAAEAKRHQVRWGVAHGCDVGHNGQYHLAQSLAKFGETSHFWDIQLRSAQRKKSKLSRKQSPEHGIPQNTIAQLVPYHYDSDFTEPSTSEPSESESEISFSTPKIPGFVMEVPKIANGQFKWNCAGCSFQIDLLNLSQENARILPGDTLSLLTSKSWTIHNTRIQEALYYVVSHHYQTQHLGPNSVDVVQSEHGKWQVAHRSNRRPQQKNAAVVIKEEESIPVESSLQLRRSSRMHRRPRRHDEDWS